jgi:tRNA-2-methylthio-N6-dimethylallyladenosine synthase
LNTKTYSITTFGCQMNEHDSEKLAGMLESMGYKEKLTSGKADVIVLNTCSVREHADERFFGILGQLKKVKIDQPGVVIAVCGCMMQQQHIIDRLKSKYPWVDLIFGTHNIHELPKMLTTVINDRNKIMEIWNENGTIVEGLPSKRKSSFKAYVSIMYGCNNYCTYCVVPYTRGRERSRHPEDILKEIQALASMGTKEVILLGQNVNSYGNNSGFDTSFSQLVFGINEIKGIQRIRFMTSHPKDLSDELVQAYISCENLSKHIHLPVQSGSTQILNKMNRNYTKEDYLLLVAKLRKAVPEIAITTDIIVGFPGETESDFEETLDLVRQVAFDSAYTFLYSVRKDTPAELYPNQVPEEIKHQRFNRLMIEMNKSAAAKNELCVGLTMPILVEGLSKTDQTRYTGRTDTNKLVNFKTALPPEIGSIVYVKITDANTFSMIGSMVESD